ncbi:MAG: lyase family protein [Treponemataceae bacterium]
MNERNIFSNLSPLDHRYSLAEKEVFDMISFHLSENASIHSCIKAELALIKSHLHENQLLNKEIEKQLDVLSEKITPDEVYKEEEKTKHNIRALVNVLKNHVSQKQSLKDFASFVHLGATSVDILDTAQSYRIKKCMQEGIIPLLKDLELLLCDLAKKEAYTPQVGRTHGQHAVPITFGFAIAEYVARLGKSILRITELSQNLKGKLSGAVGCYNAMQMIVKNPIDFERMYLSYLSLQPSEYSHQLTEPEDLLRLLLELNISFGIIANLADDLRHLQRSEINEVQEFFDATQVGSSTMPQKRNPWNCEHVKSLWKTFSPRIMSFYMDQISEHQRDLTNSASQRFIVDYLAGFSLATSRMKKIIASLNVDKEQMLKNLTNAGGSVQGGVLAEPAYILLAQSGESNAHELIRKITFEAFEMNKPFYEVLKSHTEVYQHIEGAMKKLQIDNNLFTTPESYIGLSAKKTLSIAEKYHNLMKESNF